MKATITNIRKENDRVIVFVRFEGVEIQEKTFVFIPVDTSDELIKSTILEEKQRIEAIEAKVDELQTLINLEL